MPGFASRPPRPSAALRFGTAERRSLTVSLPLPRFQLLVLLADLSSGRFQLPLQAHDLQGQFYDVPHRPLAGLSQEFQRLQALGRAHDLGGAPKYSRNRELSGSR